MGTDRKTFDVLLKYNSFQSLYHDPLSRCTSSPLLLPADRLSLPSHATSPLASGDGSHPTRLVLMHEVYIILEQFKLKTSWMLGFGNHYASFQMRRKDLVSLVKAMCVTLHIHPFQHFLALGSR